MTAVKLDWTNTENT